MHGVVSKLYDIDSIVIPEELLAVHVDEQQIADEVAHFVIDQMVAQKKGGSHGNC